jgi:hypothetical protein
MDNSTSEKLVRDGRKWNTRTLTPEMNELFSQLAWDSRGLGRGWFWRLCENVRSPTAKIFWALAIRLMLALRMYKVIGMSQDIWSMGERGPK